MEDKQILISARLKAIRKEQKLTQKEFADKFQISQASYSGYEAGTNIPSLYFLMQVADEYDLSMDYLTGRSKHQLGIGYDKDNQYINDNVFQPLIDNGNNKKTALTEMAKGLEAQMYQFDLAIKQIYKEIEKMPPEEQ